MSSRSASTSSSIALKLRKCWGLHIIKMAISVCQNDNKTPNKLQYTLPVKLMIKVIRNVEFQRVFHIRAMGWTHKRVIPNAIFRNHEKAHKSIRQ